MTREIVLSGTYTFYEHAVLLLNKVVWRCRTLAQVFVDPHTGVLTCCVTTLLCNEQPVKTAA